MGIRGAGWNTGIKAWCDKGKVCACETCLLAYGGAKKRLRNKENLTLVTTIFVQIVVL
jgi:hypothetical protein